MNRVKNIWRRTPFKWKITGSLFALPIIGFFSLWIIIKILGPPPLSFEQNTLFYGKNEEVIGQESGSENRQAVSLNEISETFIDALIVTEDQHFFTHQGFDIRRIARAALSDVQHLSLKEGASTITQQYARNLYLTHDKTWKRKIKEAFYTMRLEHFYTKAELLTGYVNTIYFGHGAHGIEAASMHYFNKEAAQLTIAESAMLAGIPKGPTIYSPRNNEEKATERQRLILQLLHENGKISTSEWQEATNEKLAYVPINEQNRETIAPHFQDIALQEAAKILDISKSDVRSGGYHIYTTLSPDDQHVLNKEVTETLDDGSAIEGGAIAIDPQTGGVRALVGGKSYEESSFNRAVQAKRMVGSTLKPILYYGALNHQFTPSTKLMSEATTFQLEDDETYQPRNYNGYYADKPITLAQALALSDNVYAVKTHLFIGPDHLSSLGEDFGISSDLPEVPSLALGSASISLVEMTIAYSHIANYGKEIKSHTVEKITDPLGKIIYERPKKDGKQKFDKNKMAVLTSLLTGMFDDSLDGYMEVTGAEVSEQLTTTYAGKSGSTSFDSWMIGFSPDLVTGVWIGFDDNRPIEKQAHTTYAKKIWAASMEHMHAGKEAQPFPLPKGVVAVSIDPSSGMLASPNCPNAIVLVYEKGTEPTEYCPEHSETGDAPPKGLFKELLDLF